MSAPGGAARAAFVLSLALAAGGLAPERAPEPCAQPGAAEGEGGRSGEVRCGAPSRELEGPARLLFGWGVDPNRADLATLSALPGIGPTRAAALAEERKLTPYCRSHDLDRVKGIGPRTREKLEPWLVFEARPGCPLPPRTPIERARGLQN